MPSTPDQHGYDFRYDPLNRLINAVSQTAGTKNGNYNENVTYDIDNMGNIKTLGRYDYIGTTRTLIDSLAYTNTGNRVMKIDNGNGAASITCDACFIDVQNPGQNSEYVYDIDGNMTRDRNKNISPTYNLLNLPQTITMAGGVNNVVYIYDSNGTKLRKVSTVGSTITSTDYIDGIEYDNGAMSFIQNEEGRARWTATIPKYIYEYDLRDHLGDTRVTFNDLNTGSPNVIQENDYYPFGANIETLNYISGTQNHYLYNHKELQGETNLYDYGARFYDPVIGRWTAIDNKAEKFPNISCYIYAANNPVALLDPDGNDLVYFNDKGQEVSRTASNTEFKAYVDVNGTYMEATMPQIIKGYEAPIFQKYDYNIAAQTYIFNNLSDDQLPRTANGDALTGDRPDDLDPTLVKAMITQESNDGTLQGKYGQNGKSDIMQANVTTTSGQTDWFSEKKQWGLEKGKSATPNQSIAAGIRLLFTKGMKTTTKDGKVTSVTWRGDDWNEAVKRYNGGGDANYLKEILNYLLNATDGTPDNYVKKDKKKKQ